MLKLITAALNVLLVFIYLALAAVQHRPVWLLISFMWLIIAGLNVWGWWLGEHTKRRMKNRR